MLDFRRSKSENCFRRSIYHNYNPLDSINGVQIMDTEVVEVSRVYFIFNRMSLRLIKISVATMLNLSLTKRSRMRLS